MPTPNYQDIAQRPTTDEFAALSTDYPIALLPVRVETRFHWEDRILMVRIYPDEISADTHEKELTAPERAAAETYWNAVWGVSDANRAACELEAWRNLVSRVPATRAAWILRSTVPLNQPPAPPQLQDPGTRERSWTRPALARLLPQRWIVVCYNRGQEVYRVASRPVQPDLALSLSPRIDESSAVALAADGKLKINADAHWTLDYDAAVQAGMAVTMKLDQQLFQSPDLPDNGIQFIFVLGVRGDLEPETAGRQALESLLDAHHYTRGLAFVAQGTPTNNTPTASSGYGLPDPGGAKSFAVERGASLDTAARNGDRLAQALGISSGIFAHVAGADGQEYLNARTMNRLLYGATMGYLSEYMDYPYTTLDAAPKPKSLIDISSWFTDNVIGRGPLSAIRVGAVPYGVLPISTAWIAPVSCPWPGISKFIADQRQNFAASCQWGQVGVPSNDQWLPSPLVTNSSPEVLLDVLQRDSRSHRVNLRQSIHSSALYSAMNKYCGPDQKTWVDQLTNGKLSDAAKSEIQAAGSAEKSDLAKNDYDSWGRVAQLISLDKIPDNACLVAPGPVAETDLLSFNYLRWLRTASIMDIIQENMPAPAGGATSAKEAVPPALLYRILRYSMLLMMGKFASEHVQVMPATTLPGSLRQNALEKVRPGLEFTVGPNIWEVLLGPMPDPTQSGTVADYLGAGKNPHFNAALAAFRTDLQAIENLTIADLERLFTEMLDVTSYRIDAWYTGFATDRLAQMRSKKRYGSYIGAFGWVEGLYHETQPKELKDLPNGDKAIVPAYSHGYVHAPSMTHAAAAAVLRNAYASSDGDLARYAINLSSSRVREGLWALDSIRNGQPLSAVLGYKFERTLHELQIEKYIAPLRDLFPVVASTSDGSGQSVESIAARNVVDGLQLRQAFREKGLAWITAQMSAQLPTDPKLQTALQQLDEALDAVTDLLSAESVFQLVRGNTTAAAASFDTMSQGVRPVEPEIARMMRSGQSLTHRVALVVGAQPVPLPAGWPFQPTPRAVAEPCLDAWLGTLLGDPRRVRCQVSFRLVGAAPETPIQKVVVTLADLKVRPIDLLWLSKTATASAEECELDRRVVEVALGALGGDDIHITYEGDPAWDRQSILSFADILELLSALNGLLAAARPLRATDLALPERSSLQSPVLGLELAARANQAAQALAQSQLPAALADVKAAAQPTSAQIDALKNELRKLALFGVSATYPAAGPSVLADLISSAEGAQSEVARRLQGLADPLNTTTLEPTLAARQAQERLAQVFGRGFVCLPRFKPAAATDLQTALVGPRFDKPKGPSISKWISQAARVRPGLGRWRRMRLCADTLGAACEEPVIAQLPYVAGEPWVGSAQVTQVADGKLSLMLFQAVAPPANGEWAGLLIDEWNEVVPHAEQSTGVSIHFDNPGSEAPQAVLLAVHPHSGEQYHAKWDIATVVNILRNTLELAKMRQISGCSLQRQDGQSLETTVGLAYIEQGIDSPIRLFNAKPDSNNPGQGS